MYFEFQMVNLYELQQHNSFVIKIAATVLSVFNEPKKNQNQRTVYLQDQ